MEKIALITGATSGIGYEIAKLIAQEKVDILLIARHEEGLKKVQEELRELTENTVDICPLDLSCDGFEEVLQQKIGDRRLVYLINNAGFGDFGEFGKASLEKQKDMINLNVRALTVLSHLFIRTNAASEEPAYLLNVASVAAFMPGPLMSVYYATKAYVASFTEALIYEHRNDKIMHISYLCPGPTETNFFATANLEKSGLFRLLKPMPAHKVAQKAFEGLKRGNKRIIPGGMNKILVYGARFMPQGFVNDMTYRIMKG